MLGARLPAVGQQRQAPRCRAAAHAGMQHGAAPMNEAPLLRAVYQTGTSDFVSMHVPGHKRGAGLCREMAEVMSAGAACDLTEITGLDYLSSPTGVIQHAQELAAAAYGAERTWFLVNGSTVGIQAAVLATCQPGDTLLVARNCHLSAFSAMVLADCEPWWVYPEINVAHQLPHCITPSALQRALADATAAGKRVAAVLLVSPTYYGACAHLSELAGLCHEHGVPLIVDEAHGAHLPFHSAFPASAMEQGADIAIQSTHKMISGLTQSAMLHVQGARVDHTRVSRALQTLQSSSPSYLLLASIDAARKQAQDGACFDVPVQVMQDLAAELCTIPGISVLAAPHKEGKLQSVAAFDPLKVAVDTTGLGLTGYEAAERLEREHGVTGELATQNVVLLAAGPGTTARDGARVAHAFKALAKHGSKVAKAPSQSAVHGGETDPQLQQPERACSPRQAFFSTHQRLPIRQAQGQASAELLCPYPPGVPAIFPGELVTSSTLEVLAACKQAGGTITGASDPDMQSLLVVTE